MQDNTEQSKVPGSTQGSKPKMKDKDSLKSYEVVHFQPFDPVHKRTETTVKSIDGKTFTVTKGAPHMKYKYQYFALQNPPTAY
jgi:magnesium-transporting ATPase (P-type)